MEISRRKPRAERLKRALEIVAQDPKKVDPTEWTFAKEIVLLDARLAREPIAPVEVQAIQLGPAVFVSCPAEYFCQYGLDIKAGSRFPFTFPVSLANDCVGYVPTEEALGPHGGGYETRLTSYSNLEPAAGQDRHDRDRASGPPDAGVGTTAGTATGLYRQALDVRCVTAGAGLIRRRRGFISAVPARHDLGDRRTFQRQISASRHACD